MTEPDETRLREQVVPGAKPDGYESVKCPMPDCDEDLYIEYQASRPVFQHDTAEDLAKVGTSDAYSSSWQIACVGGHVILQPPPTADDDYTFGSTAKCEPPDSEEPCDPKWCQHGDMARLRATLAAFS